MNVNYIKVDFQDKETLKLMSRFLYLASRYSHIINSQHFNSLDLNTQIEYKISYDYYEILVRGLRVFLIDKYNLPKESEFSVDFINGFICLKE